MTANRTVLNMTRLNPAFSAQPKIMTSNNLFAVGRHIGHDRNLPGAFNRQSELSLMGSAVPCNPSRHDLTPFGYEIIENSGIFIVDFDIGIRAEPAKFLSVKKLFLGIPVRSF